MAPDEKAALTAAPGDMVGKDTYNILHAYYKLQ